MAEFYLKRRRPERAVRIFESVLSGLEKAEGSSPFAELKTRVEITKALADAHTDLDHLDVARKLYDEVYQMTQQRSDLSGDPSIMGPLHESLGNLHFLGHSHEQAIANYNKAAEYCRTSEGRHSIEHLTMLNNIASCHFASGNSTEAREVATEALGLSKKIKGSEELVQNLTTIIKNT